jgi:NAD(P)-dependent dehydrogenase (short-subunit alcohol dehydrogenase family)
VADEDPDIQPTMTGRVCLVTGASSGIGRATATGLAQLGATVLMLCRDRVRGEAVRSQIIHATGNGAVELLLADLSSQQQMRTVAAQVLDQYSALHVLVNNAGVYLGKRTLTVDGLETTFAVNHLAYFLLTNLLLGRLKESAPSRIVNVSSSAHEGADIDFGDLQSERRYRGMRAYGQSKLANLMFTYELARRLAGSGVTVNAVHPGLVATTWGSAGIPLLRAGIRLYHPFMLTPEQGADTVIYLASSSAVAGVSGAYFVKRAAVRSSPASYYETLQQRLWEMSAELTGAT